MTSSDRYGNRATLPMVWRRNGLEGLQLALRGALRGTGAGGFIGGDPGIGKSGLIRELTIAAKETFAVHTGDCFEGEQAMPYRPWLEVLRSMGHADGLDAALAAAGLGMPVSSLGDEVTGGSAAEADDIERLRLFD